MIKLIKQLLCNHDMQKLNNQPLFMYGCYKYRCVKCGKVQRINENI